MGMTIELVDQDYQYCLDFVNGKTNIMGLANVSRIIKAVADGTRYESHLKADVDTIPKKKLAQAMTKIEECSCGKWYVGRTDGKAEEVVLMKDVERIILGLLNGDRR